jgi:hypothetical protein
MLIKTAAFVTATVALALLSSAAFAAGSSQRFTVGAVVVRSATVTSSVGPSARDGVRVQQVASRGTPAPMLLAANGLKPMPQSGAAQLPTGSDGTMTVTLLY